METPDSVIAVLGDPAAADGSWFADGNGSRQDNPRFSKTIAP